MLKAAKISDDYKEIRLLIKNGSIAINGVINRKQRVVLRDGDVISYDKTEIVVKERKSGEPTPQELERNYEIRVRHGTINEWTEKPLKSEEKIEEQINSLSRELHHRLLGAKKTISFAESCTGGMIQQYITANAGSSAYFFGGIVSYSNQAKMKILKVKKSTLEKYGAVSTQTAREMAEGIKELFQTDISVSVTGIAGPTGGSEEKPVGTVFTCVIANGFILDKKLNFSGTRENVRRKTTKAIFEFVIEIIKRK